MRATKHTNVMPPQGPSAVEQNARRPGNADASMFANLYPWDLELDLALRSTRIVDPARFGYPLEHSNETLLIEMGTIMGHEGSDYQNPYVLQSRGILYYPNPTSPAPGGLIPSFGVNAAAKAEDIVLNILSSSHILETG